MAEEKEEIRRRIKKLRMKQSPEEWRRNTDRITGRILACRWFREMSDIYCYMDFAGEVGTRTLIEEAWRRGKKVWIPKVSGENMTFFRMDSFDGLRPGSFGIPEPVCTPEYEADAKEDGPGLMIMPGVAFDRNRRRVGYGKGYYDRYLRKHPGLRTIAAAFELQLVERIPSETHDIRPEMLVTERSIY